MTLLLLLAFLGLDHDADQNGRENDAHAEISEPIVAPGVCPFQLEEELDQPAFEERSGQECVEAAKESLSKRNFPWYDEKNDDFRTQLPPEEYDWDWLPDWNWGSRSTSGAPLASVFTVFMWTLFALLLAGVIALLIYILRKGLPDNPGEKIARDPGVTVDQLEALPDAVRRYDDFLAEAERCVAAGDLNSAVVFYYSYQLLALDRAGCLVLAKGKTNRRYIREVQAADHRLVDPLRKSVTLFEGVFFGKMDVPREPFFELWEGRRMYREMMEGRTAPS